MALAPTMLLAVGSGSHVEVRELRGESLTHTLIGTNTVRKPASICRTDMKVQPSAIR